jgi:hypothetical protein
MDRHQTLASYMELTAGDRKRLEAVKDLIDQALAAKAGDLAASHLQKAARVVLQVSQDQFWRVL